MSWLNRAKIGRVERYLDRDHPEFDSLYPHQERSGFFQVVFVLVVREIVSMRYRL
jgi:hypothetical protein